MMKVLSALQSTTAAGGVICGLTLVEINALLGIILTVLSLILLIVPKVVALVNKIKDAKADGVITKEEKKEIIDSGLDIVKDVKTSVEDIKKSAENMKHDSD